MKLQHLLFVLNLLFFSGNLFGQTNQAKRLFIPSLDEESQSNIVVTVSDLFGDGQPCPMEYTNIFFNTNFFTVAEQKLLAELPLKYKNMTTNSGPPGTVLVGLYKTNSIIAFAHITNQEWVARFHYTNSQAQDEVTFLDPKTASVRFQTKSGDEYFLNMRGDSMLAFGQLKHGVANGFCASFENNHLWLYQYVTNRMAIGKYFMWNPQNNNLLLEAEFKEAYDLEKHRVQF
jgi:hypothetical protein